MWCINTFDLDSITRRNAKRAQDAADTSMYTFDIHQELVNQLRSSLGMPPLFDQCRMSMHYTEEAIGVAICFDRLGRLSRLTSTLRSTRASTTL